MIKLFLTAIGFVAGLFIGLAPAFADPPCKVYAFGDSLSDIGADSEFSAFEQSGMVEPPSEFYFEGRFSNGPVWVEILAPMICQGGQLTSFARGGAFSDDRNANDDIGVLGGLQDQVFTDSVGVTFATNDIVTLWAVNNNFVFDLLMVNPVQALQDVVTAVEALADRGAQTILVLNVPAIGDTPFARFLVEQAGAFPGLPNNLNARVTQYNNLLNIAMADLDARLATDIVFMDIHSLFQGLLDNTVLFDNTTDSCLIQLADRTRLETNLCSGFGGTLDPDRVVFFDLLHPTTAVHELIAAAAQGVLGAVAAVQAASAP